MYIGLITESNSPIKIYFGEGVEVVNYYFRINEAQATDYKFLDTEEILDWHIFTQVANDFLKSNQEYLAFIKLSRLNNPIKVLSVIKALCKLDLRPLDLFQLVYITKYGKLLRPVFYSHNPFIDLGKVIGRNMIAYNIIYKNWVIFTRKFFLIQNHFARVFYHRIPSNLCKKLLKRFFVSQQSIFSFNEKRLRLFFDLKSPLIYHSFERGTFAFIISRRFTQALLSINTPPLLSLNDLLSKTARTQNIVSLRLANSLSKTK